MSTLSPRENGSPPPFAMADPMADLRKSMAVDMADVAVTDCFGYAGFAIRGGQWPVRYFGINVVRMSKKKIQY